MAVPSVDGWALATLALMAGLVASTTLTLMSTMSCVRSSRRVCTALFGAAAAGFGLWAFNFFLAPQIDGGAWMLLPLGVAISGQGCALLFMARSEPDITSMIGSAFSLAAGVEGTRFAALDALPGPGGLRHEWLWAMGAFVFVFATCFAALCIWALGRPEGDRPAGTLHWAAVLLGASGILSTGLNIPAAEPPASTLGPTHLLAFNAAVLGCAVLVVAQTFASCSTRLLQQSRRYNRELQQVHGRLRYFAAHDSLAGLSNRWPGLPNRQRRQGQPATPFDDVQERLTLANELHRALAAQQFELFYQPQLSVRTGRIVAVEALLRWRHPVKGWIGPCCFIPLAEETGLIIPLGEWVLRSACRQLRHWQSKYGVSFPLAVNLSAVQFRHHNIFETVNDALSQAGLHPSALEIELTETALMTDPEESAGVLTQLRRMGVSVAIDDFGTGYSSLSYLRRFPIDKLKIDRSFIRELTVSRTDESIVRAIVSLARSVGLTVVAEGIETREQLECVTRLECDQWQGHYCSPPQSAERFQAMLIGGAQTHSVVAESAVPISRSGDA